MKTRDLLPQGAEVIDQGVRYRIWAPEKKKVEVEVLHSASGKRRIVPMIPEGAGYFHGIDKDGRAGDGYKFRLDGEASFPDPASRWQPDGVHGLSMVIDPRAYAWQDAGWRRPQFRDLVLYELHVGAFTHAGTFHAAIEKLPALHELGVNAIQLMPVADFPGDRNWGYDGVALYAPARCWGHPDDLRALVDAAHRHGIAVVLDVVYNHLGPDGNYLGQFSRFYFTEKHKTPWGAAINFDGEHNGPVRSFFVSNAVYWLDEFHIDGLRLDATHAIIDESPKHVVEEISDAAHARGAFSIAEDERNLANVVAHKPEGCALDAVYADDFCHSIQVALGDPRFRDDFDGSPAEIADELRHGWHYRGQTSKRAGGRRRGMECAHLAPERFVYCTSNHDQVGNRAFGERLNHLASPEAYRAASALLLLAPYTPMLFMGQEWAASTPFLYFTDHNEELGKRVAEGRRKEFARFAEFSDPALAAKIPDPQRVETFEKSKLTWAEIDDAAHAGVRALYRECIRLRASVPVFRPQSRENWKVADLGVVALRFDGGAQDWLVLADLAGSTRGVLADEDFCRLRPGKRWTRALSSNEKRFGGAESKSFDAATGEVIFEQPELLVLTSRS
jgi:malto-oligosyltrehalose trehalohydrolase